MLSACHVLLVTCPQEALLSASFVKPVHTRGVAVLVSHVQWVSIVLLVLLSAQTVQRESMPLIQGRNFAPLVILAPSRNSLDRKNVGLALPGNSVEAALLNALIAWRECTRQREDRINALNVRQGSISLQQVGPIVLIAYPAFIARLGRLYAYRVQQATTQIQAKQNAALVALANTPVPQAFKTATRVWRVPIARARLSHAVYVPRALTRT